MFRNTNYGDWNFHLFMFQFVSKRFKTIESVEIDIFSLFQFVSEVLLYNLYVSMFRNKVETLWHILYRLVATIFLYNRVGLDSEKRILGKRCEKMRKERKQMEKMGKEAIRNGKGTNDIIESSYFSGI